MADSTYKTIRDKLKTDLLTTAIRAVYDADTVDSKIYPHAVLMLFESEVNQNDNHAFGLDNNRYQVVILIRHTNPESVRQLLEAVQVLWYNATRHAALAALGGHMMPIANYLPQNDNAGKTKTVITGVLSFELDIRYTY